MTMTRSRLTSGFTAGLLTLMAIGGLSACSDENETQSDGSSGGGASSSEQSPADDDAADTDADDTDADDTDDGETDTAQSASPTDCLVGTWLADNKQLGALFKSAAAGTDAAGAVSDPTGTVLMTFGPEGQYGVTYEAWTMTVAQDGVTMELIREGTDTGKYQATDEGAVEWTEATMGSVATMKGPAGSFEVPGDPSKASGTFVCDDNTLTVTAEGSTSAFDRQ